MPDRISGLRVGRSYNSIVGDGANNEELLFNLGEKEGIELVKLYGTVAISAANASAFASTPRGIQSLHFRTGTLEATQFEGTVNTQQVDSEIVYQQVLQGMSLDGTTEGAAALMLNPSQSIDYLDADQRGLFTGRNVTHRVEGSTATWALRWTLILHYFFVAFTDAEVGILFGRRS